MYASPCSAALLTALWPGFFKEGSDTQRGHSALGCIPLYTKPSMERLPYGQTWRPSDIQRPLIFSAVPLNRSLSLQFSDSLHWASGVCAPERYLKAKCLFCTLALLLCKQSMWMGIFVCIYILPRPSISKHICLNSKHLRKTMWIWSMKKCSAE